MSTHIYKRYAVSIQKDGHHLKWMGWKFRETVESLDEASKLNSTDDAQWHIDTVKDLPNEFKGCDLVVVPIKETITKTFEVVNA